MVGPLLALGLHLLLHGVLHIRGRKDVTELDAVDARSPVLSDLVQRHPHLGVDFLAAGQRLVEGESADDVSQRVVTVSCSMADSQIGDGVSGLLGSMIW